MYNSLFNLYSLLCWLRLIKWKASHNHLHVLVFLSVQTQTTHSNKSWVHTWKWSYNQSLFSVFSFAVIMFVLTCSGQLSVPSSSRWEPLHTSVWMADCCSLVSVAGTLARVQHQEQPSGLRRFGLWAFLAELPHRWRTVAVQWWHWGWEEHQWVQRKTVEHHWVCQLLGVC